MAKSGKEARTREWERSGWRGGKHIGIEYRQLTILNSI